ncbi:hypothetical protein CCHR01_19993 [Colletotrichum chrysophilum]|uniref:Uncharacterized protein n=1 Tax=Colletotrichum chrysophilum TaxID=1836956 RepID=A0AAD8ZXC4_9PEZI|nr:hypothetical protein CCHR01_19993 [Colletotrichum chrysophilum]
MATTGDHFTGPIPSDPGPKDCRGSSWKAQEYCRGSAP